MSEFIRVILLFFIYSFIGWLWETVYCSIKAKKFVYRGFLVGPITPIYGFGVLGVLYFVEPFQNNVVVLYIFSTLLVTVLEYLTSFALEKLFHATWWDYHDVPLNINGRVAVPVSLFWGIGCVLIVKVIHPHVLDIENQLAAAFSIYLPIGLISLTTFDLGYTLANLQAFQRAVKQTEEAIDSRKEALRQSLAEVHQRVEETTQAAFAEQKDRKAERTDWLESFRSSKELQANLPRLNFGQRRILQNFPGLKIQNVRHPEEIRRLVKELRKK